MNDSRTEPENTSVRNAIFFAYSDKEQAYKAASEALSQKFGLLLEDGVWISMLPFEDGDSTLR